MDGRRICSARCDRCRRDRCSLAHRHYGEHSCKACNSGFLTNMLGGMGANWEMPVEGWTMETREW